MKLFKKFAQLFAQNEFAFFLRKPASFAYFHLELAQSFLCLSQFKQLNYGLLNVLAIWLRSLPRLKDKVKVYSYMNKAFFSSRKELLNNLEQIYGSKWREFPRDDGSIADLKFRKNVFVLSMINGIDAP